MLINLGYGDYEEMRPRAPRIDFVNASNIIMISSAHVSQKNQNFKCFKDL